MRVFLIALLAAISYAQTGLVKEMNDKAGPDATIPMASLNQSHTFGIIDFKDESYGEFWKHMPFVGQAFRNVEAYENRTYELAEVIHAHGLGDQTAVLLLHYHHQMVEGEILLETIDKTQAITRPVAVDTLGDNSTVVPHSFALQKRHGRFVWVATEYVLDVDGKQMTRTQKMLSRAGFMDAMANKLLQTGLWTVFGLQTIHRDAVVLASNEALVEESTKPWEEKGRISRFWPHPKSVIDYENNPTLLKTSWAFAVSGELTSWTCVDNCQCSHCTSNANDMDINGKKIELKATLPEPFFITNF